MDNLVGMKTLCCDKCWHGNEKACPQYIECFTSGPLCHTDSNCKSKRQEYFAEKSRKINKKTTIFVGAGTCGLGAGANKTLAVIKDFLAEHKLQADIVETGCIGFCMAEPIVDIQLPGKNRISFKNVYAEETKSLLENILLKNTVLSEKVLGQFRSEDFSVWDSVPFLDEHPFFKPQKRWVLANCGTIDPVSLGEYISKGGYKGLSKAIREQTPAEVCSVVEKSGLRGRGGGGFLTAKKWLMALNQNSTQKYFICNADEGDPGAFMDRAVIEGDPHRLLEGLAIAAYSIGASKAYIYIRAEYPLAIARLKTAITQATEQGFLGNNILDSGFNLKIIIKMGAGAFVCGEETALMHSIEGKRGMPRPRPPYPTNSGLFSKPTVINNVETLANVPDIVLKGSEWFNSVGTASSKGTKVFALSGKVQNTGLVEVVMGTKIRDIVFAIGGGIPNGKKFKAVQIGGPSGGCMTESHLDTEIDYESLKSAGAMMGSGGMVVMDEDTCMVDLAKFFMDFIQRESCGKCTPCREGTKQLLEIFNLITRGRKQEHENDALYRMKSIMQLRELAEVIRDTSLCGLGQSAPNPVLSTLRWFQDEYEAHIYERKCPAKVCTDLLSYTIVEEKCIGCTICKKKCPTEAIRGTAKAPHYIVAEKCVGCGSCMQACPKKAITVC